MLIKQKLSWHLWRQNTAVQLYKFYVTIYCTWQSILGKTNFKLQTMPQPGLTISREAFEFFFLHLNKLLPIIQPSLNSWIVLFYFLKFKRLSLLYAEFISAWSNQGSSCVCCPFWTNRNIKAVTSIFLSISLSNYESFNRGY